MAGVSASAYDGSAGSGVLADPQKGGAVMGKRLENKVAIVTGAGQPSGNYATFPQGGQCQFPAA